MNLCFEELKLSFLYSFSQRSAKKFAPNSITAREFCKDLRKFAGFETFRSTKMSLPYDESVEN